jgi:tRNA pseudouridine55 synthase
MKNGVIIINKEPGISSFAVVNKVKRLLGVKKAGHTGTLDPMATGVLPVLVGRAVKASEFMLEGDKHYIATMLLGITTDTEDITGAVLSESSLIPSEEDVFAAINSMVGESMQTPPMYSAIKVGGQKLYELARRGETVERAARKITIYSIDAKKQSEKEYILDIKCSKGTYIRSITRDIGEILGCGAVMTALKRTASGAFNMDNAVYLHQLAEPALRAGRISFIDEEKTRIKRNVPFGEDIPEDLEKFVLGVDFPLTHFGEAVVSPENARRFLDGWHLGYGEVRITREPDSESWISEVTEEAAEYDRREHEINSGSHAGIKLHPEYAKSYRIYTNGRAGERIFVGIARHSDKYHKLVPDKVFLRIEK